MSLCPRYFFMTYEIFDIIFLAKVKQQFEFYWYGYNFFSLQSVFMSVSREVAFEVLGH